MGTSVKPFSRTGCTVHVTQVRHSQDKKTQRFFFSFALLSSLLYISPKMDWPLGPTFKQIRSITSSPFDVLPPRYNRFQTPSSPPTTTMTRRFSTCWPISLFQISLPLFSTSGQFARSYHSSSFTGNDYRCCCRFHLLPSLIFSPISFSVKQSLSHLPTHQLFREAVADKFDHIRLPPPLPSWTGRKRSYCRN